MRHGCCLAPPHTPTKTIATQQRNVTNVALVLDKSGSMSGSKIANAREAAAMAIDQLSEQDIVSVITYDSQVRVIVPATRVSNRSSIRRAIANIGASGNTALFAGVTRGASELRKFLSRNQINRVVLLSDGLANVGPSTPHELGELGLSLSREGISVTTIGLGLGYNEDLMTRLAGFSDGNHAFVENEADLAKIFRFEFGDLTSVVAKDVEIRIRCLNGVQPLRILGRHGEINGDLVTTRMSQLYSEQEKYVILEVEVPANSDGQQLDLADIQLSYNDLGTQQQLSTSSIASVRFTESKKEVESNLDTQAYESAVEQVANELSREAVELRDKGQLEDARKVLQSSANYLSEKAAALASPKLQQFSEEAEADADEVADDAEWTRKRKELKERQYKRATQQSY